MIYYKTVEEWDRVLEYSSWWTADHKKLDEPSVVLTHYGWESSVITDHPFGDLPQGWLSSSLEAEKLVLDWVNEQIPQPLDVQHKVHVETNGHLRVLVWSKISHHSKPNVPNPWARLESLKDEISKLVLLKEAWVSVRLNSLRIQQEMIEHIIERLDEK